MGRLSGCLKILSGLLKMDQILSTFPMTCLFATANVIFIPKASTLDKATDIAIYSQSNRVI